MNTDPTYAEVILPVPLPGYFSYLVPEDLAGRIMPGGRVVVPFGKKRLMAGIVRRLTTTWDADLTPKEILAVLDETPLFQETHFSFWEWMARYYLCSPGEVMSAALPASFRLESETSIAIHPSFSGDMAMLTDKEYLIVEALQYTESLTISQICEIVDQKKVMHLIQGLIAKEMVISFETLEETWRPKTMTMLKLGSPYRDEESLKALLDRLSTRAFKQLEFLMLFLQTAGENPGDASIPKQDLIKRSGASPTALKGLVEKGVFEEVQVEVSRLGDFAVQKMPSGIAFSELQKATLEAVNAGFAAGKPVLLHGITGSGKTEIYIRLIEETIRQGKQALYLLPEIALTSQIINRLRVYFGNKVKVYHSKYSEQERTEVWNKVIRFTGEEDDPFVIVGARSAIFLPLKEPGLIIVDEEHDHSYKQFDPAPRYQGRDAGIMLASMWKVPVVLGSATPSIESYHNAVTGKYQLVELPARFGESVLPEMLVADVAQATRNKEMKSHYTPLLLQHISGALAKKHQVILFQNRRGFSLRVFCTECGWSPGCPHCDVTLTYHKFIDKLKCHYCGFLQQVPQKCGECGAPEVRTAGFGTEKIEEEVSAFFPDARVRRMDFDTTRTKNAYQSIIEDFEEHRIDILIGTQMVSKGLDFSNVGVVGIMNADSMITWPDFRSFERSFQHIVQVSGRAGRQTQKGTVVIQTHRPSHEVIRLACEHNYKALFNFQITEREQFHYPPFARLIRIICKSRDKNLLNNAAFRLAAELRKGLGNTVLGPEYPLVSKIKDEFIRHVMLKLTPDKRLNQKKLWVQQVITRLNATGEFRKIRVIVDVDPY